MSKLEQLKKDLTDSLKAHQSEKLGVLRLLKNSLDTKEKSGVEITDDVFVAVTQAEVKKRQDAINIYKKAEAADKAAKEQSEIDILAEYLPAGLSEEETSQAITEAIAETGAAGLSDLGKVMGQLKNKLAGRADLGQVSAQVRSRLS